MADAVSRRLVLPTELLHNIITLYVVWHIDDLIAGPLALPFIATSVDGTRTNVSLEVLRTEIGRIEAEDAGAGSGDYVVALLRASYQLRETTLKVLSGVLGIRVKERGRLRGLADKPWTYLHPVRLLYSNSRIGTIDPSLVALADTAVSHSRLLRCYRLFGTALTFFRSTPALNLESIFDRESFLTHLLAMTDAFVAAMVNTRALSGVVADAIWRRVQFYDRSRIAFIIFKSSIPQVAISQRVLALSDRVSKLGDGFELNAEEYTASVEPLFEALHILLQSAKERIVDAEQRVTGGLASVIQQTGDVLHISDIQSSCAILDEVIHYPEHARRAEYDRCQRLARSIRAVLAPFLPDAPMEPGMVKVDPVVQRISNRIDTLEGAMAGMNAPPDLELDV